MTHNTMPHNLQLHIGKLERQNTELLGALKSLVGRFEGCTSRCGSPELNAFRNANAAIARAETLYPRG